MAGVALCPRDRHRLREGLILRSWPTPKPRRCRQCGGVFQPRRVFQKWCGRSCRHAHWRYSHGRRRSLGPIDPRYRSNGSRRVHDSYRPTPPPAPPRPPPQPAAPRPDLDGLAERLAAAALLPLALARQHVEQVAVSARTPPAEPVIEETKLSRPPRRKALD
jgi:hypothetical protein